MSTFAVVVEPLSAAERAELAALDIAIKDGLRKWVSVGESVGSHLRRVRDARLYREGHATFEDYCRAQHDLSRKRAYDLVAFAEVRQMSPTGDIAPPATERVARELAPLRAEPEAMRETWADVVERFGPKPTAAQTREVVRGPEESVALEPPPRKDMRFEELEDAVAILQRLPDPSAIWWPTDEPGDIEYVDELVAWLKAWVPKLVRAWLQHKARLPKSMRPKAKRKLRAA